MEKIYDYVLWQLDRLSDVDFMKGVLKKYNVHTIFAPIYNVFPTIAEANVYISLIILAYSNGCSWIADYDKDRNTLKLEILRSILIESKIMISEEAKLLMTTQPHENFSNVIAEYLDWQKDSDFIRLIGLLEHVSSCNRQSLGKNSDVKDIDLKNRTQNLNELYRTEQLIDELKDKISRKYIGIDEALKKENKPAFTKSLNVLNYEERLMNKINDSTRM